MSCELISTQGIWMGVLPEVKYRQVYYLTLEPGDMMILYTDGIIEARNDRGEFFDVQRLVDLVNSKAGLPPFTLRDTIFESVNLWASEQRDDMTLFILKRW